MRKIGRNKQKTEASGEKKATEISQTTNLSFVSNYIN